MTCPLSGKLCSRPARTPRPDTLRPSFRSIHFVQLYEEVKRHTSAVVVAAKDGELLSHISQTSLAASEQLGALRDELRQQSYMSRLLPVDKTVKVLARSLAVVAIAADQLNSVDERYQVSAQLHDAALKAVAKVSTAQETRGSEAVQVMLVSKLICCPVYCLLAWGGSRCKICPPPPSPPFINIFRFCFFRTLAGSRRHHHCPGHC